MSTVPTSQYGAALQWVARQVGGPVTEVEGLRSITTSGGIIVEGNAERVALVITNPLNTFDLQISLNFENLAFGILVPKGGGSVTMNLTDDMTLASRRWWGVAAAPGPVSVYFLEYIRVTQFGNTP